MQSSALNENSIGYINGKTRSNTEGYEDEDRIVLRQKLADLSETVLHLERTLEMRDEQLKNVRRNSERLSAELKRQQRINRNIKQQMEDEKVFYRREKDHFEEELERHKKRFTSGTSKIQQQERKELERARGILEEENKRLKDELARKTKITYNLCIKFLRMKHAKDTLREKMDQLLCEHLQVMAEMMEKLDEAREELNVIVSEKFQEALPLSKAKFLQVVQRNTRLVHENAELKARIQHLIRNLDKLKSIVQRPKLINVDARIIARLTGHSATKEATEPTTFTCAATGNRRCMDQSGDAKILSRLLAKKCDGLADKDPKGARTRRSTDVSGECTRSAPDVAQMENQRAYSSASGLDRTEFPDRTVQVCDVSTNTRSFARKARC
ncbi:hypothetical protein KM043_004003 [Ampulex compressa]|nr:hypothetical protein KM043_004003 [Ampulex compressa]